MNVLVAGQSSVDTLGEKLIPMFGQELNITDPYWYCAEMEEGIGSEPGFVRIIIPCKQDVRDAKAYDVAYNPAGPAAQIKQGTPIKVLRRFKNSQGETLTPNLQGFTVVHVQHHHEDADFLEVLAKDCRHDLQDISVTGRFIWVVDQTDSGSIHYQQGWFPHFNPDGRPNCIFSGGGTPCFAPYPDYGIETDGTPASASDRSSLKACYWTLQLILQYLRAFYAYETPADAIADAARLAAAAQWPKQVKRFPEIIEWPEGFGSELDLVASTNFDSGVGQNYSLQGGARKGRDLSINGRAFCGRGEPGIFDLIFDAAGGWSYKVETAFYDQTIFRNTLVAVPTRFRSEAEAIDLPLSYRGEASETLKTPTITGGTFGEMSEMSRTKFVGMGSHVMIERRCSSRATDHTGGGTRTAQDRSGSGIPALLPAWSEEDFVLFCTEYVTQLASAGVTSEAEAFSRAAAKYWWVLTTWIINPQFEFMEGTVFDEYPRAPIARQIWPTLLSFRGDATAANDVQPYPVRPELYDSSKNIPVWVMPTEQDGFEVFDNGVIYLPGLRDIGLQTGGIENSGMQRASWRSPANVGKWNVSGGRLNIEVNDIRMTLAIACDHRLTETLDLLPQSGDTGGNESEAAQPQSVDSAKYEAGFSRTMQIDLNGLYVRWIRIDSWPVPESGNGSAVANMDVRNDAELLRAHIQKAALEHGRILCDGQWRCGGRFVEGWKVGTQVRALKPLGTDREPFIVNRVIARKRYTSERTTENGNPTFKNSTWLTPQ